MARGLRLGARAAAAGALLAAALSASGGGLRPEPAALERASPELIARLQADPFTYFRFVNRAWTARACREFAPLRRELPVVQLHGDAHVEQYALTRSAWGLDDFDDSVRGPAFLDIARFLGSVELAARGRGWARDRDRLYDRFFHGYRQGLADPGLRPEEPAFVRRLRVAIPRDPESYLAWGEGLMVPMSEEDRAKVAASLEVFARFVHGERPELAPGYFVLKRAGWLRMGVGSVTVEKILLRVQGPSADPDDDVLLEAKKLSRLDGIECIEVREAEGATRVILGADQLGRLRHDILVATPSLLGEREHVLEWWIRSWEPSYQEVRLGDLDSLEDLTALVHDVGVQLGAGCLHQRGTPAAADHRAEIAAVLRCEGRLRKGTRTLVRELLEGWEEFRRR